MKPWKFKTRPKYNRSKANMLATLIALCGLAGLCGWFFMGKANEVWKSHCAEEWDEVPAVVTGYHLKEDKNDDYGLECVYIYGNRKYVTTSMGYGEDAEALYKRGLKEGEVTVYVNPDDPEESTLSVGINPVGWLNLLFWAYVVCILGWNVVREFRIFRRRFYDAEYKKQTAQYLEGDEPRMCLWGRWESLDGVFLCLTEKIRKYVRIEESRDPLNGVAVCSGKDGAFFLVTENDIDHEAVVYSPDMTREEVAQWFADYERGEPLGRLIEGWKNV